MKGRPSAISGSICAAAFCAGLGFGGPATAQQTETLRQGLFGSQGLQGRFEAPPIAHYVSEDGDGFVLDLTQGRPLLKYDDSPEVWVLDPQPAPRGDILYKNDLGVPVLRATRLGGVTIFTDHRPSGEAVALAGGAIPLRLQVLGPAALGERVLQSSTRASHVARRLIPFDLEASPRSSGLIADAAVVVSEAFLRISRRADASRLLAKIQQVRIIEGRKAMASLTRGTLQIMVAPGQGIAGRPSSERIVQVAAASR